jgi:hypothetical protein
LISFPAKVEVIRLLVSNYFDIVGGNLADLVPKALMPLLALVFP